MGAIVCSRLHHTFASFFYAVDPSIFGRITGPFVPEGWFWLFMEVVKHQHPTFLFRPGFRSSIFTKHITEVSVPVSL